MRHNTSGSCLPLTSSSPCDVVCTTTLPFPSSDHKLRTRTVEGSQHEQCFNRNYYPTLLDQRYTKLLIFASSHTASFELTYIIILLFSTGISPNHSKDVHQAPAEVLGNINDKVKLACKHHINNFDTILWYHRSQGDSSLKLVGFTSYTSIQTVEKSFQGSFNVSGNGEKEAFLHMLKLRHPKDSGHYFCAAYRRTMIEKPHIPLQKPSCLPVHLEQTT